MAELYIVGFTDMAITRYVYHVPRVGDRLEVREPVEGEDAPRTYAGDVVGVTWCDGNNGAVRIEVLPDDCLACPSCGFDTVIERSADAGPGGIRP